MRLQLLALFYAAYCTYVSLCVCVCKVYFVSVRMYILYLCFVHPTSTFINKDTEHGSSQAPPTTNTLSKSMYVKTVRAQVYGSLNLYTIETYGLNWLCHIIMQIVLHPAKTSKLTNVYP